MTELSTISIDGTAGLPARPTAAVLRVIYPRELRATHVLGGVPLTLGRAPGDDGAALGHATVSRRHAQVWWDGRGSHVVRDLGSRHGTLIGATGLGTGVRALADGDVLRLGDVLVVYERGDADGDPAAVDRDALPGAALAMVRLRAQVARAATDPSPVLLAGETGTGKEWIARELHRLSGRRGPLVAVNCATLTPQLAESQLFGHVKGAFTGAAGDADGWFRQADGGTLFLDELGELPLELQPKLLRVVQDGVVQPLGASRAIAVDVRLLAATNRTLADEVERGRFRRDLHARLAKLELRVPALAERRGDVLDWIERLWAAWFRERGRGAPALTWRPAAAAAVVLAPWRDNLRGVDRLVHELALAGVTTVDVAELPGWLTAVAPSSAPAPAASAEVPPAGEPSGARPPVPSKDEFLQVWRAHGGSVRAVARHFGRDRRQIYRWLEAHGVRAPSDDD